MSLVKNKTGLFIIALLLITFSVPVYALNVAVVKSMEVAPYNEALTGFKNEVNRKTKETIYFSYYDIAKNGIKAAVDGIRNEKADLIFVLGSDAASGIKRNITDIPVVFCLVVDPIKSGLVKSQTGSGSNLAGIALDIPVKLQLKQLKEMNPGIRNVGIIYDPENSATIVAEADAAASSLGLKIVKQMVYSPKEVPDALKSIKGRIDVLWGLLDSTVYSSNSTIFILKWTLQEKIPFFGFSVNLVQGGALLALYTVYEELGEQAGEIAGRIFSGEKPSLIPLYYPKNTYLAVNLKVADLIGLKLSSQFINSANKVFK